MAFAAAATAAAAAASKSVFDYNREGFFEDREQRMKKEFAERKFRIAQAELWREDVRSFVELTEKKVSIYLLVNVLMLGFTLNLWCEGRLPEEETPDWLMMGNSLAIVGAFCFLLLTVWLAMHASVAAQSYQTRVLTQLVRLPIPSWDELEACRTYGSEFEKLEPRQMFRVPFLAGTQEDVLRRSLASGGATGTSPGAASSQGAAGSSGSSGAGGRESSSEAARPASTDPWGLEKRGDDTYELGCHIGSDVAKLRHIKLMRQAAVYWQTYDAFARVSMSIGVNQLMLAISYYILGYVLTQVKAPIPAFCGVAVLICTAEVISQIDLTLPVGQQRIVQFLLVLGPGISCVAGWHWSHKHDLAVRIAECLAPVAFFSHGIVIGMLSIMLRVREQENGAMLPLAFQGVLYLDVFGWVSHKHTNPEDGGAVEARAQPERAPMSRMSAATIAQDTWRPARRLGTFASSRSLRQQEEPGDLGYYAMDYFEEAPAAAAAAGGGKRGAVPGEEGEADVETGSAGPIHAMPAVDCVVYGSDGLPLPTRPEEVAKPGAVHDLRDLPGAPRTSDEVNALEPPAKEFWSPVTFMPPESRSRHKMDEFLAEHSAHADRAAGEGKAAGLGGFAFWGDDQDTPIQTGHDNEMPGVLPWQVFKLAAAISSLAWILGGVYFTLHINNIWTMELQWWWEMEEHPAHHVTEHSGISALQMQTAHRVVREPSVLGLMAAGLSGSSVGPALERIDATWPYPSASPWGLSCDAEGRHLLVTDGLSAFAAQLRPAAVAGQAPSAVPAPLTAKFRQLPPCPALQGRPVEDVALVCGNATAGAKACEALVLHGRGRRLAGCPLAKRRREEGPGQAPNAGFVEGVAASWLLPGRPEAREPHEKRREEVSSLLLDPACAAAGAGGAGAAAGRGCASVGTTRGRVAQLQARASGEEDLVPVNILEAPGLDENGKQESISGSVRAFGARYLGVLQPKRRSVRVLDMDGDGEEVGVLMLPTAEPIGAFCAGGGFAFLLGRGPSPSLWRLPLPEGRLRPPAAEAAAATDGD